MKPYPRYRGWGGLLLLIALSISSGSSQGETRVTIGGFVRDNSGKAISGAQVEVYSIETDAVGQAIESRVARVLSDENGRWETRPIVADFKALTLKVDHREFRSAEFYVTERPEPGTDNLSRADLLASKAVLVLRPGISVTGVVRDGSGSPISGATLLLRQDADEPEDQRTKTDDVGRFRFTLMREGECLLAVAAKDLAPQLTNLPASDEIPPIALVLVRGKSIRFRVLDIDNQPLDDAEVRLRSWRGLPFPVWEGRTDTAGRVAFGAAPESGAEYEIYAPGFQTAVRPDLAPGPAETTVRMVKGGINGRVVDADTKERIKNFQVIVGRVYSDEQVHWDRRRPFSGTNGRFSFDHQLRVGWLEQEWSLLLVESEGYLPCVSKPVALAEPIVVDFALRKGEGPKGRVRLPTGQPVSDAQVALLTGEYLFLKNKALETQPSLNRSADLTYTDEQGYFALPSHYAKVLVAVHDKGYAEAWLGEQSSTNLDLVLEPWGTINGIVRNGWSVATNITVLLKPSRDLASGLQYDWQEYRTVSDEQGRFRLFNVPPGRRELTRVYLRPVGVSYGFGSIHSHMEAVKVLPGGVTHLVYGGNGRTVIGRLRNFTFSGLAMLRTSFPSPPQGGFSSSEEATAWNNSPEVKAATAAHRMYPLQFDEDGNFRVDDVPPGGYELFLGSIRRKIQVPELLGLDEPIDLGDLK